MVIAIAILHSKCTRTLTLRISRDPSVPGELRRYRAVLGSQLLDLQLRVERAWAEAEDGGEGGGDEARRLAVKRVADVEEAYIALGPLRSPNGVEPLISGKWLMDQVTLFLFLRF